MLSSLVSTQPALTILEITIIFVKQNYIRIDSFELSEMHTMLIYHFGWVKVDPEVWQNNIDRYFRSTLYNNVIVKKHNLSILPCHVCYVLKWAQPLKGFVWNINGVKYLG